MKTETGWLDHALEHIRTLENVASVEPLHWIGDEYLVLITPTEPTHEPIGGWAQPTSPVYALLGPDGWRVADADDTATMH